MMSPGRAGWCAVELEEAAEAAEPDIIASACVLRAP